MKKLSLHFFLLWTALQLAAQHNAVDTNFHLYQLIGQSNMAGRGLVDAESKVTNPQILMLDSLNQWVSATNPVHYDKPIAGVCQIVMLSVETSLLSG
jgi:Carbohydrate esterase, sialic acid-specific acetylesterase